MDFVLNERLAAGGFGVGRVHGCRILLKNEANFPWLIVVPEVSAKTDNLHQLDEGTFAEVMLAIRKVSLFIAGHFNPEKLNVACIGNIVRQMHIHVVGRFVNDSAWPGVVWSYDVKREYQVDESNAIVSAARIFLKI